MAVFPAPGTAFITPIPLTKSITLCCSFVKLIVGSLLLSGASSTDISSSSGNNSKLCLYSHKLLYSQNMQLLLEHAFSYFCTESNESTFSANSDTLSSTGYIDTKKFLESIPSFKCIYEALTILLGLIFLPNSSKKNSSKDFSAFVLSVLPFTLY